MLIVKEFDRHGLFMNRLFRAGFFRLVLVDEALPANDAGQLKFAKIFDNNLFVPLLEKSVAKVWGSYESLCNLNVLDYLSTLTGFPCERFRIIPLRKFESSVKAHDSYIDLWIKLVRFKKACFGYTMGAVCRKNGQYGLKEGYTYSMLNFVEFSCDTGGKTAMLVQMKNLKGK